MTTTTRPPARPPKVTDTAANVRKLPWGEGQSSRANDKISAPQKRLIILRHLALSIKSEPPAARERSREPDHAQDTTRDSGAPAMTYATAYLGQLYYTGTLTPINWVPGTSTISGTFVSASTAMPTVDSGVVSGCSTFLQGPGWSNYKTPICGTLLNQGVWYSEIHLSGMLWNAPVLAPMTAAQVFSTVGNETIAPTEEDAREAETGMHEVAKFLRQVYDLSAQDEHRTVDAIYDFMDGKMLDGDFPICDVALKSAQPEKMPLSAVISFLIVTRRAAPQLKERKPFFDRALAALSLAADPTQSTRVLRKYQ